MIVKVNSNDNSIDWGVTGTERIIQNVKNILRTRHFEVPFMPRLGINHEFIESTPQMMKSELSNQVIDVINAFEPRATVLAVKIENCDENGDYTISVELEV